MNTKLLHILFFALAIVPWLTYSQTNNIEVKGIILDESNYPVPFVAVGIVEKYIGTASTEDGEFSFLITKDELKDSLSISSLGFDPYKIMVEDYLKLEKKEIVLKETVTELNEITLLSPKDYVINAMKAMKDNTISDPHKIELLYRRAGTEGGRSKFFVENYIKIRDKGPGYGPGLIQVTQVRKSADYRIWKTKQWQHSINSLFNLNPFRPHASQHKRNLKKFNWKKTGDSSYEGEDVVIVRGENPDLEWEKIVMYIGVDSYKVYRIERGRTLFVYKKHQNGKLVLSYFKNQWNYKKHMVPKQYWGTDAESLQYRTEAFVYNVETDKKKFDVYPFGEDTDMGLIDLPYDANFWKNLSMPPDTEFFRKIKSELESNYGVPLETQFELVNK